MSMLAPSCLIPLPLPSFPLFHSLLTCLLARLLAACTPQAALARAAHSMLRPPEEGCRQRSPEDQLPRG